MPRKLVQSVVPKGPVKAVFPSLDIFKLDPAGSVLWRDAVESLAAAKARIQKLALSSPGEYLIFDQKTGNRIRVAPSTQAGLMDVLTT